MGLPKFCHAGKLGKDLPSVCIALQFFLAAGLIGALVYLFVTTELL